METLYRKVVIKSEDDLPKVDGEYYVHYKEYGMGSTHIYLGNDARKYTWLNGIDWYLQPIEQDQQALEKSADKDPYPELTPELIKGMASKFADKRKEVHKDLTDWEWMQIFTAYSSGLGDVLEYAQLRSEQRQVTDEEIEKWAKKKYPDKPVYQPYVRNAVIESLKAMRDGLIPRK